VTGERIAITGATTISANGALGGGTVKIGGDYQGSGDLKHASTTAISKDTRISASATKKGKGGRVIVWSDKHTQFDGHIAARRTHRNILQRQA